MERHVDAELRDLKEKILAMGGCVERAIQEAINALIHRDSAGFDKVMLLEATINQYHMQIDQACLRLLARQSPLATDLRWVVAIIKINTDLERMGDQSVNIAHNGRHYLEEPALKPLIDLPKMATEVQKMVRDALDAVVQVLRESDPTLARSVLRRDDLVDELKDKIFEEVIVYMKEDPQAVQRGLNLILIARNLERLGDHATNIAEDVIFITSGEDIRHGGSSVDKASGQST